MPEHAELLELQREWRNGVSLQIRATEAKLDLIIVQLGSLREEFVKSADFNGVKSRVENLESDRAKLVGAAVLLNFLGGVVIYLVAKFWK